MTIAAWILVMVVVLAILFIIFRIMKSCLPKVVVFLAVLGALAFLAYWYFTR